MFYYKSAVNKKETTHGQNQSKGLLKQANSTEHWQLHTWCTKGQIIVPICLTAINIMQLDHCHDQTGRKAI
jgi:hypothetical protein